MNIAKLPSNLIWIKQRTFAFDLCMAVFVFEIISELFPFGFVPLFATVASGLFGMSSKRLTQTRSKVSGLS